tara:strand:- start:39189 stop:39347 length:159 start_codon:yes stop_codon:yes gene_type:complete
VRDLRARPSCETFVDEKLDLHRAGGAPMSVADAAVRAPKDEDAVKAARFSVG